MCALIELMMRTNRGVVSICFCALIESALFEVRTKRGIAVPVAEAVGTSYFKSVGGGGVYSLHRNRRRY